MRARVGGERSWESQATGEKRSQNLFLICGKAREPLNRWSARERTKEAKERKLTVQFSLSRARIFFLNSPITPSFSSTAAESVSTRLFFLARKARAETLLRIWRLREGVILS